MRLPPDPLAERVRFGVELETSIPSTSGVTVGGYHSGIPVRHARTPLRTDVVFPSFTPSSPFGRDGSIRRDPFDHDPNGPFFRADRDGSIRCEPCDHVPCEFVSPVMFGPTAPVFLLDSVTCIKQIGAAVNASCGCHVTVGISSVVGTVDPRVHAHFIRKLVRVVKRHTLALYAQSNGTRHTNPYSVPQPESYVEKSNELVYQHTAQSGVEGLRAQRGALNLRKAFLGGANSAVEFRAFGGTRNRLRVLHHVCTCIGLCLLAHETKNPPLPFTKKPRDLNAVEALESLWRDLGWAMSKPGLECERGVWGAFAPLLPFAMSTCHGNAVKFLDKNPNVRSSQF